MKIILLVIFLAAINIASADVSHLPSPTYVPSNMKLPSGSYLPVPESNEDKHVYFYGSADSKYYTNFKINVVPKAHKNTKIIFVKAPHHAGVIPQVISPPSSAEDRTSVYVLVKNPIESQSIDIPAGLGVKQVKPDVFFLKYNNKHDAENQINSGIQGQQVGENVNNLENQEGFLSILGNGDAYNGGSNGNSGPY